jgi:hypothetical protein
LAFDNLSTIPDWLSDAICRLSTGGGFATRSLYTDDEEVVFSGKRPVVFNGIVPVADAADLRDRALLVTWPKMKSAKTERKLDPAFKNVASHVFGAILDAVVLALAGREAVEEEYAGRLPRMGDFFCWVVAAEAILPWPKGTFERVYAESRTASSEIAVSESAVALALRAFLEARVAPFEGTATALLASIADYATPPVRLGVRPPEGWPKTPTMLSHTLRRMAPDLRLAGVSVEFPEGGRTYRRDRPPCPLVRESARNRVGGRRGRRIPPLVGPRLARSPSRPGRPPQQLHDSRGPSPGTAGGRPVTAKCGRPGTLLPDTIQIVSVGREGLPSHSARFRNRAEDWFSGRNWELDPANCTEASPDVSSSRQNE